LDRVQKMLKENDRSDLGQYVLKFAQTISSGATSSVASINGPKAISSLEFKLEADDLSQALRSTVLKITFDGAETVWCPIGDFFGTGYHIRPHATWYTAVTKDNTLACYWVMPFEKKATIDVLNLGSQNVKLAKCDIRTKPWKWDKRSCYFHAAWKQWPEVRTQSNEKAKDHGALDLNWVTVKGKGTYVGDVLTLFNTANTWWGEGDEKIYVDGERFPSHIGTGTEDYYGYAWCKPAFFQSAFHAQPSGDGNLKPGFTVNSRFRALDAIPFTRSIQFDMELWHWAATTMSYAPTTFWYARPGATWDVKPDAMEAKRAVPKSVEDIIKPRIVEGAIEGENVTVLEKTGGTTEIQHSMNFNWSRNAQLWWRDGRVNDRLLVEFEVPQSGTYNVTLGITKAIDYAICRIEINGEIKARSADFFNNGVIARELRLGRCRLLKGKNKLRVTITGSNPEAIKKHMFGLDYILPTK
ncbi:MAG: glycoside hydrolase family 172 protein, partial [Planctomycetota bacterium]